MKKSIIFLLTSLSYNLLFSQSGTLKQKNSMDTINIIDPLSELVLDTNYQLKSGNESRYYFDPNKNDSSCILYFQGCDERSIMTDFTLIYYNFYLKTNDSKKSFELALTDFNKKYPNSELQPILECNEKP